MQSALLSYMSALQHIIPASGVPTSCSVQLLQSHSNMAISHQAPPHQANMPIMMYLVTTDPEVSPDKICIAALVDVVLLT